MCRPPRRPAPCRARAASEPKLIRVVAGLLASASIFLPVPRALAAPGETGFASLTLGVGARAMGMGSAYVALAEDPTAIYWNPAGLAGIPGAQATVMHNEWILDFRQEFAALAAPLAGGAVGLGFSGFYTSELEERDATGTLTGHFGFNDLTGTLGYARKLGGKFSAGAGIKFVREMIAQEDAATFAFDLGGRFVDPRTGLSAGAAIQNVGGDATFVSESFSLPRTLRAGAAWTRAVPRAEGRATVSAEWRKSRSDDSRLHLGAEFDYRQRAALRAGWKFGYDDQDLSFGLGLKKSRIAFAYALVPFSSNLGTTHFFSLTMGI